MFGVLTDRVFKVVYRSMGRVSTTLVHAQNEGHADQLLVQKHLEDGGAPEDFAILSLSELK